MLLELVSNLLLFELESTRLFLLSLLDEALIELGWTELHLNFCRWYEIFILFSSCNLSDQLTCFRLIFWLFSYFDRDPFLFSVINFNIWLSLDYIFSWVFSKNWKLVLDFLRAEEFLWANDVPVEPVLVDGRRTWVEDRVMCMVTIVTANVEAIQYSWRWRCFERRYKMSVEVCLCHLKKASRSWVEFLFINVFNWFFRFLKDSQLHWLCLRVGNGWFLCRPIRLKSSLTLGVFRSSWDFLLLFLLLFAAAVDFTHFYIERVFFRYTLIRRLIYLQVFYAVLIILLILNVDTWIANIFEHITFSSQVYLIRHSLNLSNRFLPSLTLLTLLLLRHGCLLLLHFFRLHISIKGRDMADCGWRPSTSSRWGNTLLFDLIRLVVVRDYVADAHLLICEEILLLRFYHVVLDWLNIHCGNFNVSDHVSIESSIVYWNWVMVIINIFLRLRVLLDWFSNILTFFLWHQKVDRCKDDPNHSLQVLLARSIVHLKECTLTAILIVKELSTNCLKFLIGMWWNPCKMWT